MAPPLMERWMPLGSSSRMPWLAELRQGCRH